MDKEKKKASITAEVREKSVTYITAGFALVAGLAWNDAVKSSIEFFFPLEKNSILIKFIFAIIITVVVVILTSVLMKIFRTKKD